MMLRQYALPLDQFFNPVKAYFTEQTTDPHSVYILYEVLFFYGHRRLEVFRSHNRWQPLLPLLMDHVMVEIDPDIEDTYAGTSVGRNTNLIAVPIPIEARLRSLSMRLLFEVCRMQVLSVPDLSKQHSVKFEFPRTNSINYRNIR